MKRTITVMAVLSIICLLSPLSAGSIGVGASGGILIPIIQEDQESGQSFGLKVRFRLTGPLFLEPNLYFGGFSDAEIEGVGTRDGSTQGHYGVDLTLGGGLASKGIKPYAFIGGGVYNIKRENMDTENKSGWSFGLGLNIGVTQQIAVGAQGRVNIIDWEESSSKKSAAVTGNVIYYFGVK